MDIEEVNRMDPAGFLSAFGGIYEHSPWVAERCMDRRPFASGDEVARIMAEVVDRATDDEKLALIRAHPDLAGKLARAGGLTAESTREQAGLGLDRLADEEFETFTRLNEAYRAKFGFPFIICARLTTKAGVLAAFETRLLHDAAAERNEAIRQIHRIARLRLEDMLHGG
jgi:2-oxo-4-hydroxy-4-carboxy-5-ureidoimidazoline decarboxylase